MRSHPGHFAAILGVLISASSLCAHELDHFSLPVQRPIADLGDYMTEVYYDNLVAAVTKVNKRIDDAIRRGASESELARLRSARTVVSAFVAEFPPVVIYIEDLEAIVRGRKLQDRYPGKLVAWRPAPSVFDETHFPIDTKSFFLLWRSSLLKVNGVFLGTDKFGHFLHNGANYYAEYHRVLDRGSTSAEALHAAIQLGAGNNFLLSEKYTLGKLTSGVVSNADLAANYFGMQFLRNFDEPISVAKSTRPPILRMVQGRHEIAPHVSRTSDFLTRFFTDHYDEVLNPNQYDVLVEAAMRNALKRRRATILSFYCDPNGEPLTASFFRQKQLDLRTLWGEEYGYLDHDRGVFSVVDIVWPAVKSDTDKKTLALVEAAEAGDAARVRMLLDSGVSANATLSVEGLLPAEKGATALHYAAVGKEPSVVGLLLAAGGNLKATTARGVTPLHKSVMSPRLISTWIQAGADVDAVDQDGRTPLHWAARANAPDAIFALLGHGATLHATDNNGNTPLHDAAYAGAVESTSALLSRGAETSRRARYGVTPLHAAVLAHRPEVVETLLQRDRASLHLTDDMGRSAAVLAESLGAARCSVLLNQHATPSGGQFRQVENSVRSK
ncbi:MAG: ankyrin repeat domain-containing protein [Phycisphaerae bacterium]